MNEFLLNFSANFLSDAILGIVIYIALTKPGERRRSRQRRIKSLGLLKSEIEMNVVRAKNFIKCLALSDGIPMEALPLQLSRGAWNALKEGGQLVEIDDVGLTYHLFRMNEASFSANKNLRRYELAHLENTGGRLDELAAIASGDCKTFLESAKASLEKLSNIDSVSISAYDAAAIKR